MNKVYKVRKNFKYSGKERISNLDYYYGPWNSVEEACENIPENIRGLGLTVGVIKNDKISEYQWKEGILDQQLVLKIEQIELTISKIQDEELVVEEGESILFLFEISGRASISKGLLYIVLGGQEVFLLELPNIAKGLNTVVISSPSISGIYTYHIKVLDTAGYSAKTENNEEYISYTVLYGGISININTSNFDKIKIKNILSLSEKYFTINISVRDDSFQILDVQLFENENNNFYSLIPYKSLSEENNTYLGFNYYILPNSENFSNFDGKDCFVKVLYIQDGENKSELKQIFTLLKVDSLNFISQGAFKNYYLSFSEYYKFLLLSGVENLSVLINKAEDSDFNFDSVTISTYNTYSLRIVPNNVKQGAILSIDCVYYVNNIKKTINFKHILGNIIEQPARAYYEPSVDSNIQKVILVEGNDSDFAEEGKHYKVIEGTNNLPGIISDTYYTSAFILDFYCKIPKTNIKDLYYVKIFLGNSVIGYITEDKINCKGINTDTPLNEWVLIGLGYNLEEQITRGGIEYQPRYFAIYINGMIVKNVLIEGGKVDPLVYDRDAPIRIEFSNGIHISKGLLYYSLSNIQYINPLAEIYSIIYKNYMAHFPTLEEPEDLPILKFWRITDENERRHYFDLLREENSNIKHLTVFGSIGLEKALNNMTEYDSSYGNSEMDHDNATLFRLSVNIKKPAQKEYCVLCRGKYSNTDILNDCIIEVHTLGTSTLVYPVPNFKFTFWKEINGKLEQFRPPFIKDGENNYYEEHTYTAKADFMDSSHLNNTPTCIFYNNLIHNLIENNNFPTFNGSPSARNNKLDAIVGIPIIMEISDYAEDENGDFLNIGSFMLNVDKTGNSLGFEILENQNTLSCISFEGTSNDNNHGAAGRFDNNMNLEYYDSEADIDNDYEEISQALAASNKKLDLSLLINNEVNVTNHKYVKWCKFLSDGLEYRYPDSDIYKTSEDKLYLTKIMKKDDFKKLYRMWSWVSKSDIYSPELYKAEFENYFDLNYCILYFIQLMIFAQTDNLGKNCMFDCWDGEHWYPRPYDLDSLAGLDNNGNDNIAPFVEIKPTFSLNYDPSYTREELEKEYLIHDDDGTVSKITYNGQEYDRYHFSSDKSKLWTNFYNNYKDTINGFYKKLRVEGNYTPESIINLCENSLIKELGTNLYNKDFQNKYLATEYQYLALGNRWYKFKKWLNLRFAFCDSYFNAGSVSLYGLISRMPEYSIEMEFPLYVQLSYQDSNSTPYFVVGNRNMPGAGSGGATKFTLTLDLKQVLNSGHFKYVIHESGSNNYDNLISLDVSGNKLISSINTLVGNNLVNLRELNISNSSVNTLKSGIPVSLKKLIAREVHLNTIVFPEGCLVEEIDLSNSIIDEAINFEDLPNLKRLTLTNCTFNNNIKLRKLPILDTFIFDGASFKENIIISDEVKINEFDFSNILLKKIAFEGTGDIDIKKLNFIKTKFTYNTINLDSVSNYLEEIYFNNCEGLTHIEMGEGKYFNRLKVFSILDSSITSIGTNSEYFDVSKFNNLSNNKLASLLKVTSYNSITRVPTQFKTFTFENTKIVKISNLDWNGSGNNLFRNCYYLTEISGTLKLTEGINNLFDRCLVLLTIPNISNIIIDDSVISANYSFREAHLLGYSKIESIINKCIYVTDFEACCEGINFGNQNETTIRLNTLFENNSVVSNLNWMFSSGGWNGHSPGVENKFRVTGTIPSSVKKLNYTFFGYNDTKYKISYSILSNATSLEEMIGTFYRTSVEFTDYPQQMEYNYLIDSSFFVNGSSNNNIKTLLGTFEISNIEPFNSNIFKHLSKLENCVSCFRSSSNKEFKKTISIDNLWDSNPLLNNVSGCFLNIINIYCNTGLNFNSEVLSIDISGLFGIHSNDKNNSKIITLNISNLFNNNRIVICDDYHSTTGNTAEYRGVFEGRRVVITDGEINNSNSILFSLSSKCRKLFYWADLYIKSLLNTLVSLIDLSNVSDCGYMFSRCKAYKYNSLTNYNYTDNDSLMLDFILPTNCINYYEMFSYSEILNSLPNIRCSSASNMLSMYNGCMINKNELSVPSDYFLICKNSIQNTSYMFYNNKYITELEYNEEYGLFSDCISLINVKHMFEGCSYLHRGIPNNLFGYNSLPNLKSIESLFASTNVMLGVENGSKKWINSDTFAPLINLEDISKLFYNNKLGNVDSGISGYTYNNPVHKTVNTESQVIQIIDPETFFTIPSLKYINEVFKNTTIVGNIPLKFNKFEDGTEAFYGSNVSVIDSDFIPEINISYLLNVSRMFYWPYELWATSQKPIITNLSSFIEKLRLLGIKMTGIAYGIENIESEGDIKDRYTSETGQTLASPSGRKSIFSI